MSQGIRNRRLGDVFVDEVNNQEYILAEVKFYFAESYTELLNKLKVNYGDNFRIANLGFTPTKQSKARSAVYVRLENKSTKEVYPLVRFFEKQTSTINLISWSGTDLLKDFNRVYGISPRLGTALSTQFAYRVSKVDFSDLFSKSQQTVGNQFLTARDIITKLISVAEADKGPLSPIIVELLYMTAIGEYGTLKGAAQFEREIGIYASEFIVPLAIVLQSTEPVIKDASGGDILINTKANDMGFDAKIKAQTRTYFISVKQGGAGYKHGAYGSIAYIKQILENNKEELKSFPYYGELERYRKILDLLLGVDPVDDTFTPTELEARKSYTSKFNRKTYRNLFILAKELNLPGDEITSILKFVGDESSPLEDKLRKLNRFAIKIYDTLNKDEDFNKITKALLQFNNFIQGRLLTRKINKDDLDIIGVRLDIIDDEKTVQISGQKSYYGDKFATGHGGFLLKEILGLELQTINNQNQE